MEAIIHAKDVSTHETRAGSTRFVVRDDQDHEYVTFRPQIGEAAQKYAGKDARILFHEEQRGEYTNVYLDAIEPAEATRSDADAAAWLAAVEAAPVLVGDLVDADQLYDRLKPLKDRIAEDIKRTKK